MKYSEQASRAVPILTKSSYVLSDYLLLVGVACIGLGLGWFFAEKTGIKSNKKVFTAEFFCAKI